MAKKKAQYQTSGDEDGWCVTEDGGVLYDDLTEAEATKLAAYMNETGRWSYNDVWEYMGWEKP